MSPVTEPDDLADRLNRLDRLIEGIEGLEDGTARDRAREAVGELLDLHGAGLARIVDVVGASAPAALDALAADPLTRGLLLLHGVHPVPLETRVQESLDTVRPYMKSHGGGVEVIGLENGILHLRLDGSCDGCGSSAATLRTAVEAALLEGAPDLLGLEVEGVAQPPAGASAFIPLSAIGGFPAPAPSAWEIVSGLDAVASGSLEQRDISGTTIVLSRLGDDYYAYASTCPGCGATLAASITDGHLGCSACDRRFDIVGAGQCSAEPALRLAPFPLVLQGAGTARVAVPAASR